MLKIVLLHLTHVMHQELLNFVRFFKDTDFLSELLMTFVFFFALYK